MKKALCVVAARRGSKGLESKCMQPIGGKPVVEHVIAWAADLGRKKAGIETIVTSDISELEMISQRYSVAWRSRPAQLADDTAHIEDVMMDALECCSDRFEFLALLYGNVPVRHNRLFLDPLRYLENHSQADAVLTFQEVEKFHPDWMVMRATERLPTWKKGAHRRQDLTPYMIHDGHTILLRMSHFIEFWPQRHRLSRNQMYEAYGFEIKPWLHEEIVIDIDTRRDYLLAKAYMEDQIKGA